MLLVLARTGFAQFCPVAKAAELLAERWMPVVVRELLADSCHFGELRGCTCRIRRQREALPRLRGSQRFEHGVADLGFRRAASMEGKRA